MNEQPNKKTIQRVVFHFPKQFFPQSFFPFHLIWEKKLIKNENLIQSGKFFPHSNIYWEKEKGKYEKRVRFQMPFQAEKEPWIDEKKLLRKCLEKLFFDRLLSFIFWLLSTPHTKPWISIIFHLKTCNTWSTLMACQIIKRDKH